MELSGIGIWTPALMRHEDPAAVQDAAAELEDLGYTALWIPEGSGGPIFEACGRVLDATTRVPVATGILNVWKHEPSETAAGHARLAAAHPDRFLLGLGISHRPLVEGYRRPLSTMRAYLDGLDAAEQPVPPGERAIAALGPKMLDLARDRALGSHTYFTTAAHTAAAREALGPDALLAPEVSVVPIRDRERAFEVARDYMDLFLRLPNYTNNLLRHGFSEDDVRDGGSDRLLEAVLPWGEPERIMAGVQEHFAAGADHVCIQVISGRDRMTDLPREEWRELAPALVG